MQKYLKNNKGFTLVEVIVVAVIVLILAAVAIPLYQGYVQSAREGALENAAGSIATACGSALALNEQDNCEGTSQSLDGGTTGVFVSVASAAGQEIGFNIPARMSATITGGIVTVQYNDGSSSYEASAMYKRN